MITERATLPEPFRSQIEAASHEFTAAVVRAFEQCAVAAARDLARGSGRGPATPQATLIEDLLRRAPEGLDANQIHRAVSGRLTTVLITLQQMVERGRLVRHGTAAGNRYHLR